MSLNSSYKANVWSSHDMFSDMHALVDNGHGFLVQCIMHRQKVVGCQFHMHERRHIGAYMNVLCDTEHAFASRVLAIIICFGVCNRFVPHQKDSNESLSAI